MIDHRLLRTFLTGTVACVAVAGAAVGQTRTFNVPAGDLKAALDAFGAQSGIQLIFRPTDVRGVRSPGVSGALASDDALSRLLVGTGFRIERDPSGAIAIMRRSAAPGEGEAGGAAADDSGAEAGEITPEILVVGSRPTFNADIRRSEDDSQPYVVVGREEIERSGATDVEDLLRRTLTMQTRPATASQSDGSSAGNSTNIALRGLDSRQTLILVDGRRLASRGDRGSQEQPDLGGIPLLAIERIEVLPTSASGIYGGGATGGVINIILRRDYSGIEVQLGYGNVLRGDAPDRRIDLAGGLSFNNRRTSITFSASVQDREPLLFNDTGLIERGRAEILANNPAFFFSAANPPLGATPNLRTVDGTNLRLKPSFGGTTLTSPFTFVPAGYRGALNDGVAALIANAGQYNLDLANTAQAGGGGLRPALQGATVYTANLSGRHRFSDSFESFVDFAWSENEGSFVNGPLSTTFVLPTTAPNNPFAQNVRVTVPLVGADSVHRSRNETYRVTAGLLFDLPFEWRGGFDYSWQRTSFGAQLGASSLNGQQTALINNGTIDLLSDLPANGFSFANFVGPRTLSGPGRTTLNSAALRLSGPLPLRLPGGSVRASLLAEARDEVLGAFEIISPVFTQTNFERSQRVYGGYAELLFPVVGPENHVPGVNLLELRVAGRADTYRTDASNAGTTIPSAGVVATPREVRSRLSSIDPSISLRWKPIPDVMLRGSYATGYLPPTLFQLAPSDVAVTLPSNFLISALRDPARGNEPLGQITLISGGSPDLEPETSTSWSAGVVLTPSFVPGLRLSADWTNIRKRNNVTNAIGLILQARFLTELALFPERFIRSTDPSTFGAFGVGPITTIDQTFINVARTEVEAIDFSLDYSPPPTRFGAFAFAARATRGMTNTRQLTPVAAIENFLDTSANVSWQGSASLTWTWGDVEASWNSRYIASYFVLNSRAVDLSQGSARVPDQSYHDLSLRYSIPETAGALGGTEIRLTVRNLFDRRPPFDSTSFTAQIPYSPLGDPRGRSFYLTLRKAF